MKPIFLHAHERPLTWVTVNSDGDLLLTSGKDNATHLWYTKSGEHIGTYDTGSGVAWACDATPDSRFVAIASADLKCCVFELQSAHLIAKIPMPGPCRFVSWAKRPTKALRLVTVNDDFSKEQRGIRVSEIDPHEETVTTVWNQSAYLTKATQVHWGVMDNTIISIHIDGRIMVWDAESGNPVHEFQGHLEAVTCASFAANRLLMLTCSADGSAKLWRADNWECVKTVQTDRPLNACGLSPLVDSENNKRTHILLGGGQAEEFVTTTSDLQGKFEALIFNITHCEEVGRVHGHFGTLHSLRWLPDGTGFVSGGADGYARIYHFDQSYFGEKYD